MKTIEEKLEDLRALVEHDQIQSLYRRKLACQANLDNASCFLKPGKKYTKLDSGTEINRHGKYMIDNATGEIFGIKAYGQVHKGHRYGTLDTIHDWYWGDYHARRKLNA